MRVNKTLEEQMAKIRLQKRRQIQLFKLSVSVLLLGLIVLCVFGFNIYLER